jgi:pimeloyl-ACP methyl ester carboxylesterase
MAMKRILFCLLLPFGLVTYGQERYISIDGQKYRIKEFGAGEMTVLFECGMSDSIEVWGSIPDSIALHSRVFMYDRADIGKSGPSGNERTIPNMVEELRNILEDLKLPPPYILVGHSMGSLIMRYFAGSYPDEVKGLLLLDPCPESWWKGMSKKELTEYIQGGTEWYETRFPERFRKEWYQFIPNLAYMDELHINIQLPVILVSATGWGWYEYQKDILTGFENAMHIELEGEHHIFKSHPGLIISYIKELLL